MSKFLFSIFYGFSWVLTLLPLRILYVLSDLIFVILYWGIRYRRKVVLDNLTNAFPKKSEKDKKQISRKYIRHLCDLFFETIKMMHMTNKEIQRRVRYEGDYMQVMFERNKNIVGMLGHTGNWEWLTSFALQDDYHWAIPYHPLRNSPHFDNFMLGLRSRYTAEPVPMKQTYKRIMEIKGNKQLFVIAMVADQSPPNPKNRSWLTFLNQDTAVMEGSERIAQKADAAVMYCKMVKVKRGHYKMEFIPITNNAAKEDDFYITKRYYELLEEHICEQPEYWLWSHRHWKHKPPQEKRNTKS